MNDWKEYAGEKLGLSDIYSYFQAGVLIIDLKKLREYTTSEKMLSLAASDSFRCHDQDVLNILFKGRVFYLPQKWNVLMDWREPLEGRSRMQIMSKAPRWLFLEYMEARKDPFIVHYAGYQKPWDVADCDMADDFCLGAGEFAVDIPNGSYEVTIYAGDLLMRETMSSV